MNNSFPRLIDGMCATLRSEVLSRLDDEFARGQVFGVINLLNTFKVRASWSEGFLLQQIAAQEGALQGAATIARPLPAATPAPEMPVRAGDAAATPIDALLARRDANNLAIGAWLGWLEAERARVPPAAAAAIEKLLRTAMRAEIDIERKNSPRPLFAEMSSGREEPG
jgi:hypothetical protein